MKKLQPIRALGEKKRLLQSLILFKLYDLLVIFYDTLLPTIC